MQNFQGETVIDILKRIIQVLQESSEKEHEICSENINESKLMNIHQRQRALEIAVTSLLLVESATGSHNLDIHSGPVHREIDCSAISWSPQNEAKFLQEQNHAPKSPLLIHMD